MTERLTHQPNPGYMAPKSLRKQCGKSGDYTPRQLEVKDTTCKTQLSR